jgi:hypothetical protein
VPVIQAHEVFSVTVQVDTVYPDDRRVRPRTIECNAWAEASASIERALKLFAPGEATVMVSRELVESWDGEDPSLDMWPSEAHILTGPLTKEDF